MPWDIENYHIVDGRVLNVEISIPLVEFLYTSIDDVQKAWVEMLGQFIKEQPGLEMAWEMRTRGENALVTIMIGKEGELSEFTEAETKSALDAADAMYEKTKEEAKKAKSKKKAAKKSTPKSKSKTLTEKTTSKRASSTKKKTKSTKSKKKTKAKSTKSKKK